ncbi:reverse transcriptase domain-containing protein [Tanacetum coccineum]
MVQPPLAMFIVTDIQEYVSQAAAANFNQGNTGYRALISNQIDHPRFSPVQNIRKFKIMKQNITVYRPKPWKFQSMHQLRTQYIKVKSINLSPWVSPIHCVPKKGGITVIKNEDNDLIPTRLVTGWRVCIDYRKLNEATRKDHFPLPFMDQMLERLAGNQYYCFLDGFSGYFQIPIDPKDQEKTTFTCPYGTFVYRRMPFRLCNAPGTFQRCMMAIFHDMIEKTMEVFMDDFSVFGDSFSTCLSHLEKMLKRCEDTNLSLNWEKSHFMGMRLFNLGRISLTGFPARSVESSNIDALDSLYLLVLVIRTSQSRQHVKSESDKSCKSPTTELFDVDSGRISIHHFRAYMHMSHLFATDFFVKTTMRFSITYSRGDPIPTDIHEGMVDRRYACSMDPHNEKMIQQNL